MATDFTPFASLTGGLAIGLGAVLLMLGLGRILGATGIMSGLVFAESREEASWRIAMVIGYSAFSSKVTTLCGRKYMSSSMRIR